MNLIVYIIVYPILWLISILPFRLLYAISDLLYLLIFYVIGYRKKVVLSNLQIAFPNKELSELKKIRKQFYRHFVDIFMEMIKSFTISEKQMRKRYIYTNINLLNDLYKNGKSTILVGAHYANWEWLLAIGLYIEYECYAAYNKIGNNYLNRRILKSRARFGAHLKVTGKIIAKISANNKANIQSLYGLVSDQSPTLRKTFHWNDFFGVKVPFHTGAEMLAKKYDLNIVMVETRKVKRGYYENTLSLITDDPKSIPNYELSDLFMKKVEAMIIKEPAYYFWTHKRFKHRHKAPK